METRPRRNIQGFGSIASFAVALLILLQVGRSVEQGNPLYLSGFPAASPLVDHRGQYHQLPQQVIVPGGFQSQPQISESNFPRGFDSRRNSRVIPSIQNGHFQIRPSSANIRPEYASVGPSGNARIGGPGSFASGGSSSGGNSNDQDGQGDVQYEYYDGAEGQGGGDIVYAYSEEDPADGQRSGKQNTNPVPVPPPQPTGGSSSGTKARFSRPLLTLRQQSNVQQQSQSGFIPLVEEDEEPLVDPSLALKGRSVNPQLNSRNVAASPNPTPLPSLLRNTSIITRNRSVPPPPIAPTSAASSLLNRRPGIIRGPVNRFVLTSRPSPPTAFSREVDYSTLNNKDRASEIPTSRAVGSVSKNGFAGSNSNRQQLAPPSPSSDPSEEEYYLEEPKEYYEDEVEEEEKPKVAAPPPKVPETKTKVTVSVSTKTRTTATTPTPSPLERLKATPGPGIVISVATTRSIQDGAISAQSMNNFKPVTQAPPGTTTPKVTFSRATGSSIVVASVQTSKSIATPSQNRFISSQHPPQDASEYYEEEEYSENDPSPSSPEEASPSPSAPASESREKLEAPQSSSPKPETQPTSTTQASLSQVQESIPSGRKPLQLISSLDREGVVDDGKGINIQSIYKDITFKEDVSAFLPPDFKLDTTTQSPSTSTVLPSPPPTKISRPQPPSTTTTTGKPEPSTTTLNSLLPPGIRFDAPLAPILLPKDYIKQFQAAKENKGKASSPSPVFSTTPSPSSTTTTPTTTTVKDNLIESLFSKLKFNSNLESLLPPGYDPSLVTASSTTTAPPPPKSGIDTLIQTVPYDDISRLLPPGFKYQDPSKPSQSAPETTTSPTTTTPKPTEKSLNKLVFPTRAGGFKAARPTSTEPPKAESPPPPKVTIQAGWPTRKTTDFTGWPTSSTEATTTTTTTTTSSTSTTPRPTTTTPRATTSRIPPKQSPISTCNGNVCRWEAVMRVVGQRWVPELATKNTQQWRQLERDVKGALDAAYKNSNLAEFYRSVEIEAFTEGIIVDYFVNLVNVTANLTSNNIQNIFHKSLPRSDHHELPEEESESETSEIPSNERLRLGRFYIDPSYTDFKIRNESTTAIHGASSSEGPLPQWGIAVIVIGLASLMFVVIFGVTVLVSRHKNSKKKNAVSLTQEMLSEFNKSHLGVDNYGADDLYNMDDVWNDKQPHMDRTFDRKPGKRASSSGKSSAQYNIYDSWKTEWNGYYYNGNYYGDSGYAPTRRRSDYDTNF